MKEELINLKGISKSFDGQMVLDDMDLVIHENEFVTLLGPSGCGKTTTLRIIGGFTSPDKGRVYFEGKDITDLPANKRQLNTVFQKYALFTHMSIAENIAFGLKIKNKSKSYIDDKIKYALKLVNLEGYENRSPELLSGGQQQRIAIARAIVNEPRVLLLDEPLGALDLKLRQEMQYELIRMKNELGITFIYVTHDQEEALTMSDRIVVMNKGVIEQDDNPDNIYHYPSTKFVAKFIGESNFFDTETETLALRPEKLNLCEEAESEDKAAAHPEPAFYGTVVDVVFYGTIDKVFVRLDNSNQTVVAYQYFDDVKRWTPDERVGIWWYERDEVKVQR